MLIQIKYIPLYIYKVQYKLNKCKTRIINHFVSMYKTNAKSDPG